MTEVMTTYQKIKLVTELVARKAAMDHEMDTLARLTGSGFWTAPLGDAVYKAFELSVDYAERLIGDEQHRLNWWLYENDHGQAGMRINGRGVGSVKALVNLIERDGK